MKKFNFREKRKNIMMCAFLFVSIAIVTLTVAYASLSATLKITGSTDVVASTWDVYIANSQFTTSLPSSGGSGTSPTPLNNVYGDYKVVPLAVGEDGSCVSGTNCINSISGTTLSFSTMPLYKPGDFKAISFDVINGGSIDAKLDSFILNGISDEQDVYLNYYIKYSDGSTIKNGDKLSGGTTKGMILVIEFDKNVTSSQLPTTGQSLSLSFTLNYVQAN